MNFPDYFDPVDFSYFKNCSSVQGKYIIGHDIAESTKRLSDSNIHEYDMAIVGIPMENRKYIKKGSSPPDIIRNHLYSLARADKKINIVDFGNLKPTKSFKGTLLAVRDITEYLRDIGITTIFIGGSQDLTAGICEAFKNVKYFTLSDIDAVLDIKKGVEKFSSSNYLTNIFKSLPNLFQFNLIGYQNHLVGEKLINKIRNYGERMRLGQLRDNFAHSEPLLRNADVVSMDLGVINYSDAPGTCQKNPNGLRGEEACRLARYSGMSDNLKVFSLFELNTTDDKENITAKLAAEIIWYFIDGFIYKPDYNKKIVYKVEISGLGNPVIFLQEPVSNRWWFEIKSVSGEKKLIACTENEYFKAADNEIPDKWLKFVQKMDAISK
jgi:formiminoglutamase